MQALNCVAGLGFGEAATPTEVTTAAASATMNILLSTGARSTGVYRYLLRLSDDEPHDPPAYLSLIHNWTAASRSRSVGASSGGSRRIDWGIPREPVDAEFHAIFFVEPL